MYKLNILTSTTRPGRKGPLVADWIHGIALQQPGFTVRYVDLAEVNLPLLDEGQDPKKGEYTTEHARRWSEIISEADAFIIVLAEYNHGYPAPIKNALDYLFKEWQYKPVGLVSYGGLSGGVRSVEALKGTLSYLKMSPLAEAVHIPFFEQFISKEGKFKPDEKVSGSAKQMFKALSIWIPALKPLRTT